ncbi:TatD family hydrolase [Nitrincola alkalilacustris]|uniref:TatD family hydrolase n=1 Tax=Nitrincola alkalilacustris TaxID=1571224 RepID=UPI00124C4715|nr:TatD family hydrolase [Nitrincola alkalilacustris]
MSLIDTHCHLDFPEFDSWREQAIAAAREVGIETIIVPGVTVEHFERVLSLSREYPDLIKPALGLHPCFMAQHQECDTDSLEQYLQATSGVVAVGEIGLDFFIQDAQPERQIDLFRLQLLLAQRHDLPVLLHVRKAHDEVLKQLRRIPLKRGGIVHAFSGSQQQARQYAELGFRLGFGGAMTYDRATKLRRLASELPLEWLVLETDAPDMPLEGFRGQPNFPAQVARVAALMAELRQCEMDLISCVTSQTAKSLLRL